MKLFFYIFGLIAIVSTIRVIINPNPMRALLSLGISLLSITNIFFLVGAYFAGALETIIYTGAVMVLFIFVVMMLNTNVSRNQQKYIRPKLMVWISPIVLSVILLVTMIYAIMVTTNNDFNICSTAINAKSVSTALFGPYVLLIEPISMLLLASLIVISHLGMSIHHKKHLKYHDNNNRQEEDQI